MIKAALIPIVIGLITWGSVQLKMYIEEQIQIHKEKKRIAKREKPKVFDHKWEDDD